MLAPTHLTRLLLAAAGALALCLPASPAAAEAPPGTSPQPGETSSSSTSSPAQSAPAPTLTVEPAPTPPPSGTRTGSAPAARSPRVHVQHAQGATPGGPAGANGGRAGSRPDGSKAGAPSGRPKGPRAPSPSALTPPLPLAFSASLSGIPAFFIESFRIPPFLLPIFQAAGTAYGVPWQVLAAINEVETDYGRDLSVSSAGAEGWMQFLPSSWAAYGVDANGDGFKDPYNPADAIFAAARYLRAAGAATNLRGAIFAYNHSRAYVESVLLRARLLGGTPSELLGALTGLTEARFPVHASAHFSDGFPPAPTDSAHKTLVGTTIYSRAGAPVIAVQDGQVTRIGDSRELGRFISLRDAYGNTYTYAQLGHVARFYPVLQPHEGPAAASPPARSGEAREPAPTGPASAGAQPRAGAAPEEFAAVARLAPSAPADLGAVTGSPAGPDAAPGLAAAPSVGAPAPAAPATPPSGPATQRPFRAGPNDVYLHPLRAGVRVIAGTVLGHVGAGAGQGGGGEAGPRMLFQIRPAGVRAPLIDPKPILDGWVQLENTSVYRASAATPFAAAEPSPGQVLLESKQQLESQVLANRAIRIQRCGRQDVRAAQVDRRVLATLEFLAVSGLGPTASGLPCARPSGAEPAASAQGSAEAVDITAINGVPIAGHEAPGSITDAATRKLLTLQGPMRPRALIAPERYADAANPLASADRHPRIRVSFAQPPATAGHLAGAFGGAISPSQWIELIARLGEIPSPVVRSGPSPASILDHPAPAGANAGAAGGNG